MKNNDQYQCPKCARSEIQEIEGRKGRFCSVFSHVFRPDVESDQEDLKKAVFTYVKNGWTYTRECRIVAHGWKGRCAGFRELNLE